MKFPYKLYVKTEDDGDISYFVADAELLGLVNTGEVTKIGVYQLVETLSAEAVVKTSSNKRK